MQPITPFGSFTPKAAAAINGNFNTLLPLCRFVYYVDALNGNDGNDGQTQQTAFRTFYKAYAACVPGKNDAVAIVADGATDATVRIDSSFTWDKNETHLFGIASGVNISNRARIAPTSTTTAFTPYWTVSASGCRFDNIQWFMSFTTDTTAQIGMVITGGRNLFTGCHIAGMGQTTSATSATSRSLKISGTGENQFANCTFGLDTVTRTGANATLEFAGATPRNKFTDCLFLCYGGAGGAPIHILGTGADCIDREQIFDNCKFVNSIKSGATALTSVASLTDAAPGGLLWFTGNCATVGATKWGDTNALANSYIDGPTPTAASTGLGVNPS